MVAIENTPLFGAIEIALNRILAQQESLLAECAKLDGRLIRLTLTDFKRSLIFSPHSKGITVIAPPRLAEGVEVHATIEATLVALGRAAMQAKNGEQAGLPEGMRLAGDTEIAHQFSQILGRLDVDWEAHIAGQVGDVLAHQVGQGVRGLLGWGQTVFGVLSRDAAEFVREEAQQTPHPDEVAEFVDAVDDLRSGVDRLEAKITSLAAARHDRDN